MTRLTYEKELLDFARELTDLKTAQRKAFGTLNFYVKEATYYSPPLPPTYEECLFTITATAKAGEVSPFFVQLAFGDTSDLIPDDMSVSDNSISWRFYYNTIEGKWLNFRAIATSDFDLTVRSGS